MTAGIHETYSSNCIVPAIDIDLSKVANRKIEMASGSRVKAAAIYLVNLEESPGTRAMMIAPASGRKMMVER